MSNSSACVVDLTHAHANDMPVLPGLARPLFANLATVAEDGYAMSEYRFVNHTGTHVDAPAHQVSRGETLDAIPP